MDDEDDDDDEKALKDDVDVGNLQLLRRLLFVMPTSSYY